MLEWIKKHKVVVGVIMVVIIFVIPFLIHCAFKVYSCDFLSTDKWDAGDILQFYGSMLAFIGTVSLGVLSLHQNQIIKEESDKRIRLQELRKREMIKPMFRVRLKNKCDCNSKIEVQIENITDNDAFEVYFFPMQIINSKKDILWKKESTIHQDAILGKEIYTLKLQNDGWIEDDVSIKIGMKCNDKYGGERKYNIYAFCKTKSALPHFYIKEIVEV